VDQAVEALLCKHEALSSNPWVQILLCTVGAQKQEGSAPCSASLGVSEEVDSCPPLPARSPMASKALRVGGDVTKGPSEQVHRKHELCEKWGSINKQRVRVWYWFFCVILASWEWNAETVSSSMFTKRRNTIWLPFSKVNKKFHLSFYNFYLKSLYSLIISYNLAFNSFFLVVLGLDSL
jgi:hypothetical protein